MEPDAARCLLVKLRRFVEEELDVDERGVFGALVAPALTRAFAGAEVEGFGFVGWSPDVLPDALIEALRDGWWPGDLGGGGYAGPQ